MSDQTSVFETQPSPDPENPADSVSGADTLLSSIKNEAGEPKYLSVDDALKGGAHAQDLIRTQTASLSEKELEIATLKAQVAQQTSMEELVKKMSPPTEESVKVQETPALNGLDAEGVNSLIAAQLQQAQVTNLGDANERAVDEKLKEVYGSSEKAAEILAEKAKLYNQPVSYFKDLARKTPDIALQVLGASTPQTRQEPASPAISSNSVPSRSTPEAPRGFDNVMRGHGANHKNLKASWVDNHAKIIDPDGLRHQKTKWRAA